MRGLFLNAIEIQKEVIVQANRMIEHYEYALGEMAEEKADPKMLELCKAIVQECA